MNNIIPKASSVVKSQVPCKLVFGKKHIPKSKVLTCIDGIAKSAYHCIIIKSSRFMTKKKVTSHRIVCFESVEMLWYFVTVIVIECLSLQMIF